MSKKILYWTKSYCNVHIAALINFKGFRTDERPITIGKEIFLLTQEKLTDDCLNNLKKTILIN